MKDFFTSADCDKNIRNSTGIFSLAHISLERANALIRERLRVVYGIRHENEFAFSNWNGPAATHQALLICIEPIGGPDSAESLLRELIKCGTEANDMEAIHAEICGVIRRARKLLDEQEKK